MSKEKETSNGIKRGKNTEGKRIKKQKKKQEAPPYLSLRHGDFGLHKPATAWPMQHAADSVAHIIFILSCDSRLEYNIAPN